MRYGILSDIHGSDMLLKQALQKLRNVDKIFCCGDVIGKSGDSLKCLDMLIEAEAMLVSGNHDRLSEKQIPEKYKKKFKRRIRDKNLLFSHTATCRNAFYGIKPWHENNKIDSIEKALDQFKEEFFIFFYGHKHQARIFELNQGQIKDTIIENAIEIKLNKTSRYLCNPGPITKKKDKAIENPHRNDNFTAKPSFIIYDSEKEEIKYYFLD